MDDLDLSDAMDCLAARQDPTVLHLPRIVGITTFARLAGSPPCAACIAQNDVDPEQRLCPEDERRWVDAITSTDHASIFFCGTCVEQG